jgi:Glycosyl transferase family 2
MIDERAAMLVSILIPCFNAERWIGQAIESALAQTYMSTEIIVVDDGSTDGSLEVLRLFGQHIRWETGPNRVANVTRKGFWLQYLDADDYLISDKIEAQMALVAECHDADVIYSPIVIECWPPEPGSSYSTIKVAPTIKDWHAARWNLGENGATEEEIEFLIGSNPSTTPPAQRVAGRRVELNAFTSDALVAWIEGKLQEHGVEKFIPDDEILVDAYRRANEHAAVQELIDKEIGALREKLRGAPVPEDLRDEIEKAQAADPTRSWDSIVMELASRRDK